jgi:alanyl-tRNA synthetase
MMKLPDTGKNICPAERVLNGNKKDNFWEMGDSGPCGPCSEIHVDIRSEAEIAKIPGIELVNKSHPQVIEIWNLVFIQFNRKANGQLGRITCKTCRYRNGFRAALHGNSGSYIKLRYRYFSEYNYRNWQIVQHKIWRRRKTDIAMRVIADHLRAVAFAIADGQLPSNNKAGYVIRRILRRAVRYGYTFLNFREAFIFKLVEVLKETMGDAFPELKGQQVLIEKVIKEEEESFLRTLSTGIRLLDEIILKAKQENRTEILGKDAFVLFDTFGFPLDLTDLIARENGLSLMKPVLKLKWKPRKTVREMLLHRKPTIGWKFAKLNKPNF